MYRYETHMHTAPVSKCGKASVEESLRFYKEMGYTGVFVTNHFIDGNLNIEKDRPYEEKIQFYFSDYEKGVQIGKELGIQVFCGVELSLNGTDFLVYGLDKQWYLDHPEIQDMKKSDELTLMMESGALIIQAHPYREASYIDHIRLFPRHVHGVEVLNASQSEFRNNMAKFYAQQYELLEFAGSDNHRAANAVGLAGISTDTPILDEQDFVQRIKSGNFQIFSQPL